MIVTPELIDVYKKIILDPQGHGLDFKKLTDFFEKSESVTAKHILAKEYMDHCNGPMNKLVLYIIMDQVFGQCNGKDSNGNLGYYLKQKEL